MRLYPTVARLARLNVIGNHSTNVAVLQPAGQACSLVLAIAVRSKVCRNKHAMGLVRDATEASHTPTCL